MQCKVCGYNFEGSQSNCHGCSAHGTYASCASCDSDNILKCPNCGHPNLSEDGRSFEFIDKLYKKIRRFI